MKGHNNVGFEDDNNSTVSLSIFKTPFTQLC